MRLDGLTDRAQCNHPTLSVPTTRWVVLKFGGTSVSTALRWKCIYSQIVRYLQNAQDGIQRNVWLTISAMTQVTNKLQRATQLALQCRNESSPKESHLELVRQILIQHFMLAYEIGLFPSDPSINLEILQQQWITCVFENTSQTFETLSSNTNPSLSVIPQTFHPLLKEFQHLVRVLEGIRLTEEASPRIKARVLAFGELISTQLGLCILQHLGLHNQVQRVDARKLLQSDPTLSKSDEDKFLQAEVPPCSNLQAAVQSTNGKRVVITQGFIAGIGSSDTLVTCVLGRGGSDTSGSLFAALLNAEKYEIWTDVHGMFTSDPRHVTDARLIKSLDYREAQELAAMGAKVLHPRCIIPAQWAHIPIEIRNTNDPNGDKTIIHSTETECMSSSPKILAVVRREGMTTLSITAFHMCGTSGFLSKVFAPFETYGISVDLIATSQFSVTVTLDHIPGGVTGEPFRQLLKQLDTHSTVKVFRSCSVVSIVGRKLRKALSELGHVFGLLEGYDVLLLSESAEDLNLSFVIKQGNADAIVEQMHKFFFSLEANTSDKNAIQVVNRSNTIYRSISRDLLFGSTWEKLQHHTQSAAERN
uniref:aspartate kinase n=1 Tax=Albugo laibachii Nc14 TaxID=890382 RepID=F0WRD1_9STRA|nr:aspartokinase putative [Albugo laibachii Nc14]|eukprot:CCA23894.1 aspartokinase putative [Albugo laibachii Nc14]